MSDWSVVNAAAVFVVIGVSVIWTIRFVSAEIWPAHAARANKEVALRFLDVGRMPLFGRAKTEDGAYLDTDNTVVVRAVGNSLGHLGIADGSRLVARKLETSTRLEPGDLVVLNADANASNVSRRLRVVERVDGDKVTFRPDPDGRPHKERVVGSVEAKVTHLLT